MGNHEAAHNEHDLWVCNLGLVGYGEAVALQERVRAERHAAERPDTLLMLEHPPVYTRGRRARPEELALGEEHYRARGIEVFDTDRGGRVTYHGPGQLVGYPIMAITDVAVHLRRIEAALIAALAGVAVAARSRCEEGPDYTGVWVGERKIASIGVHVSRGVTTHGFAVNVENDLAPFSWVVACGLPDVAMTSLAAELPVGARLDATAFRCDTIACFARAHGRAPREVGLDRLLGHDTTGATGARPAGATDARPAAATRTTRAGAAAAPGEGHPGDAAGADPSSATAETGEYHREVALLAAGAPR